MYLLAIGSLCYFDNLVSEYRVNLLFFPETNVIGAQFRVSSSLDKGSGEPCGSPIVVVGVDVICEGEAYCRYLSLGIEGKQGILAFCGVSAFVKGKSVG